jgi:hypothetical protein
LIPLTLVAPITDVVAPVPNVAAPVADVIAFVEDMLTSVAGAVIALTQLQSDLAAFLFDITRVPVVHGWGGIDGAGLSAAAYAWVTSQLPLTLLLAGIPGVPLTGNAAGVAPLGGWRHPLSERRPRFVERHRCRGWHRSRSMAPFRLVCSRFPGMPTASTCFPRQGRHWPLFAARRRRGW